MSRLLKDSHVRGRYSRKLNELKWSRSNDDVRRRVLEAIRDSDLSLGCILLNKANVYPELRDDPSSLYNYQIVHSMLWSLLPGLASRERMKFCMDLSMSKVSRDALNKYICQKAEWIWTRDLARPGSIQSQIEISHEKSGRVKCLQAADYLAGSAFSKFERNKTYSIF